MLELNGLTKMYGGIAALSDVSMRIEAGKVTALVGENGAGKSTLVKCITGLVTPDAGEIRMDGKSMEWTDPLGPRAVGIEAVYQNLALVNNLDVSANVFLGRELGGRWYNAWRMRKTEMYSQSQEMLDRMKVPIAAKAKVRELSGGQRQSVSVLRATGFGARMILMDEPTAALGVRETKRVLDLIQDLASKGLGVLVISHNLDQVRDISDDVWVLRRGQMVAHLQGSDIHATNLLRHITGLE